MRCDDCQADKLAQPRFCECCGRPEPAHAEDTASVSEDVSMASLIDAQPPMEDVAPTPVRCESCGGPADEEDGALCAACERVFRKVLQKKTSEQAQAPPMEPATAASTVHTPPPPLFAAPAIPPIAPAPPEPKPSIRRASAPPLPKPSTPRVSSSGLGWAAAFVIVAVSGVGAVALGVQWLDRQWALGSPTPDPVPAVAVPESQTATAADAVATNTQSPIDASSVAAARVETPTEAASVAPLSPNTRKLASMPATKRPSKIVRPAKAPAGEAIAPAPAMPTPPPVAEVLPASAPVVPSMIPVPEPVVAPVGPLFETSQVNDPPRVTSRVEPQVPDHLQGRPLSDVVILRVLVSHVGRASTVNVLRKSKAGAGLDEAVVAAVKQWRFEPARKRGQPVSCWYNLGVPLRIGN